MQLAITGKDLQLTGAISQYTEKKIGTLDKYFDGIMRGSVTLGMETHHHQKGDIFYAECKLEVPGTDIFAKTTSKDVYSAIDILLDSMKAEIKKHKQKLKGDEKKKKITGRSVKEYQAEAEEEV